MIRLFTAFSGYDSQCIAMERTGKSYDLVGWSEIDNNAIKAHNALFPEYIERNYGDICSIDWNNVPDFDWLTYSSPCQDFSRAGLMKGGVEGSGTRSSLLWQIRKAVEIKHPRVLILENVSDLVSKRFKGAFDEWLKYLESHGYRNYWKVINAVDHGIPQNRRRVYLISILGEGKEFEFPKPQIGMLCLRSLMERNAPENLYKDLNQIPCILTYNNSSLRVKQATKTGYADVRSGGVFDVAFPNSKTRRGRVQGVDGDICPTLTASSSDSILLFDRGRARSLTSSEKLMLMGLSGNEIKLLKKAELTERELGKLAGNSIVVNVLVEIYEQIFKVTGLC